MSGHFLRSIPHARLLTGAAVAILSCGLLQALMPLSRALLLSFDLGMLVFISLMVLLMQSATPTQMKARACTQEDGKWTVLVVGIAVAVFVLRALSSELSASQKNSTGDLALACSTLFLAWLFVAFTFSQQYAHKFYTSDKAFIFPGTETPDYWDFLYFSMVISMCCQTSDVTVNNSAIRRVVLLQSVLSFLFNVIIISITVGVVLDSLKS